MFILERALNIFTLIYEMEAHIKMKDSHFPKMRLENPVSGIERTFEGSVINNSPINISLIPNQLILNPLLLNELNQQVPIEKASIKRVENNLTQSHESFDNRSKLNQSQIDEDKNLIEKPFITNINSKLKEDNTESITKNVPKVTDLGPSKFSSPSPSNIQKPQQNNISVFSSPSNVAPKYQAMDRDKLVNTRDRNISGSSPRFVRVNSNLVDNTFNSQKMAIKNIDGVSPTASSRVMIYNTNVQPQTWRTVWPSSNIVNGGVRETPISSTQSKAVNNARVSSEQLQSPIGSGKMSSNAKYTVTPNPSVVRYIEKNSVDGFTSPVGFSPLASPTYRKNVSQGKSGNISNNAVIPNSSLNNQFFSYKN
ncbi:putative low complexity protein [Cryptosporidium felis]|nr:putative low complexity protein [Cryptosporidium felis]